MRSVFSKLLLCSCGVLALALAATELSAMVSLRGIGLAGGVRHITRGVFVGAQQAIEDPSALSDYLPYGLLLLAGTGILCWLLALRVVSPLRRLTAAVNRFGDGDLSSRVKSDRTDEIGHLSETFDRMADRIETKVTAEHRLVQDLCHELRAPLSRLSLVSDLVRNAGAPECTTASLKQDVQQLATLVGTLMEITYTEAESSTCAFASLGLELLIAEAVEDCRLEAEARGCGVEVHAEPDLALSGDGELLRRAFENVIRNAIQHSPRGSCIDIFLERAADIVRAGVRDYGPGVAEPELTRIFQPFYRTASARDAVGGAGLGLAITARAVSIHQGRIWASNAEPGLMVWIELPVAARSVWLQPSTQVLRGSAVHAG